MKTFSIKTLGCKANQYESSLMAAALEHEGLSSVQFGEISDIVIINTCTVTDNSDKKCRNYIRQGARFSRSGGVIVTGCLARRDPTGITAMSEVCGVVDTNDRKLLSEKILNAAGVECSLSKSFAEENVQPFEHTRGLLRIQDGCDGECSYCIVPAVRGKPVSRPVSEVISHAKKLIFSDVKEIVLSGITIGKYNDSGIDFAALVEKILSLDGDFRLRITSVEPRHVTQNLIELYKNEKLCPHIHLPLQSGSDRILSMMMRPYNVSEFVSVVSQLRDVSPVISVGTDVIVGFPGEETSDFEDTFRVCEELEFSYIHQFTFSPRSGTVAAESVRASKDIIAERAAKLKVLSKSLSFRYAEKFVGQTIQSVIEVGGYAQTPHYLKVKLTQTAPGDVAGMKIPVYIERIDDSGNLFGRHGTIS